MTTDTVHVRTVAGLFGVPAAKRQRGDSGVIVSGPLSVSNYTWWYVDFTTGVDGWVAASFLQKK